jgi:hypothetical protein
MIHKLSIQMYLISNDLVNSIASRKMWLRELNGICSLNSERVSFVVFVIVDGSPQQ